MMAQFITRGGRLCWDKPKAFCRANDLPYGLWTCQGGREVLFNRFYEPIWQRQDGTISRVDPKEWVPWSTQKWFYDDGTPESGKWRAGAGVLSEWGIDIPDWRKNKPIKSLGDQVFRRRSTRAG